MGDKIERVRGFEIVSEETFKRERKATGAKYEKVKEPVRATKKSAGYDFFMPFTHTLMPGKSLVVPTFVKAYMLDNEFLTFAPRSGVGFKYFLRIANIFPVIDADYYNNPENEGMINVKVRNEGESVIIMREGEAYFQGIFLSYKLADGDNTTAERVGGGGSTDRK